MNSARSLHVVKQLQNLTFAFMHLLLVLIKRLSFELRWQSRLCRSAWSKRGRLYPHNIHLILEIEAKFTADLNYK
jgi:hypothetical protein